LTFRETTSHIVKRIKWIKAQSIHIYSCSEPVGTNITHVLNKYSGVENMILQFKFPLTTI